MTNEEFIYKWGQSDEEIASELGYDIEELTELLQGDYYWLPDYQVWIPSSCSLYTAEDEEMVDQIMEQYNDFK